MAETANAAGVLLPGSSRWDSFTTQDGDTVPAGEKVIFHLYDVEDQKLIGPFDVRKDDRAEFTAKNRPLTKVKVTYGVYPKSGNQISRVLNSIEPVK